MGIAGFKLRLHDLDDLKLADLQRYFMAHGYPDPAGAMHRAIIAVGQTIRAEATIMGYADSFCDDRGRVAGRRFSDCDAAQGRCSRRGGALNQA